MILKVEKDYYVIYTKEMKEVCKVKRSINSLENVVKMMNVKEIVE